MTDYVIIIITYKQRLKPILDTDFEFRLKSFKTEIDIEKESKIYKINTSNQN